MPFLPLSESPAWSHQRRFYQTHGTQAWRRTPHYVTNNPYIAVSYTDVAAAFVRDLSAAIDPSEPIYIVELGAGSGRLGFYIIEELRRRFPDFHVGGAQLCYVFTDVVRANLDALMTHPRLAPHFAADRAEVALFDAENDETITLAQNERTIARGALVNPLVVIANYVFDGVRQDLIVYDRGKVFEGLVDVDLTTADDVIGEISATFDHRPFAGDPFEPPSWNAVVRDNASRYDRASLCFPSASLRCIERLSSLTRGGALLLAADRRLDIEGKREIDQTASIKAHGGFSFAVDFDTLSRVLVADGWSTWRADETGRAFAVLAAAHPPTPASGAEWRETRVAAARSLVDGLGPDAFYALTQLFQRGAGSATLDEMRAFFQLSYYDSRIFQLCYERLRALLPSEPQNVREAWREIIDRVARAYFPIDDGTNPVFGFASLMLDMGFAARAVDYFALSAHIVPHDRAAHMGLARALRIAGDRIKAEFALLRARQHSASQSELNEVDAELQSLRGGG